jgi:hypothetical protein
MNTKDKISKKTVIKYCVAILIMFSVWMFFHLYKPVETTYIYYETNITGSVVPRQECVYVKVVTRDTDELSLGSLLELNMSKMGWTDDYKKVPECTDYDKIYFTEYSLSLFCNEFPCDIRGDLYMMYHIKFLPTNLSEEEYNTYLGIYEEAFEGFKDATHIEEEFRR